MKYSISQIKAVFAKKGYRWFEGNWNVNLIGVRTLPGTPNVFDDLLYVGVNNLLSEYSCTTDPGTYWLENPMTPSLGTAIVKPGQYSGLWWIDPERLPIKDCLTPDGKSLKS